MDVTAVGICSSRNGVPEIKACKDLPYFPTEMTKDQMVSELSFRTKVLLWSGIVVGAVSIGILLYAIVRNWRKWKQWWEQRTEEEIQSRNRESEIEEADEEVGDIGDGQLCVICLMRRCRSAFISCGHMVCCQRCSLSVERDLAPKCPVCRQPFRCSISVHDS